ncbi:TLR13 [Mytilus edulis]|uniref:TLR13 n=1 Tax=Mytilus edulis TaxID=6550 RepID=A0A8S3PTT4_MYTED|nr:TLR13 [Mytilus edulis]
MISYNNSNIAVRCHAAFEQFGSKFNLFGFGRVKILPVIMINNIFLYMLFILTTLFVQTTSSLRCHFDRQCICYNIIEVQYVNCSKINITTIPTLPSTTNILNLNFNLIVLISNGSFHNLNHLLELDLSWNKLERLELGSFTGLVNLQKLTLEHNNLSLKWKSFPLGVFAPLKSLRHLKAKYNDRDGFLACKNVITNLKQLESVEIDIEESEDCPEMASGFSKLTNLKSFRTGYCDFTLFGPHTFKYMTYLQFVDISWCRISVVLASNRYSKQSAKRLEYIDLSFNVIHKLHFSIFDDHPKLKTINLSDNILSDISFDISTLRSLEMLNLSHNNIQAFSKEWMNDISNIARGSGLKIDLSKNDVQCGCNKLPFIQWMLENRHIFIGIETYRCNWMNNSVITIYPLRPIVLQLEKECASYTVLIACITSGIAFACVVLVGGLGYRYRWRLRYIYHMTRSKYKRYRPILDDGHYTFDAFISYSDEEQDFLFKDIIPNLEQKESLKLCIHQRDFLPGEDITQNITNAIHKSRKTVCIITRSFLDSYYCMFEFNMARMESIYSRGGQNIYFSYSLNRFVQVNCLW